MKPMTILRTRLKDIMSNSKVNGHLVRKRFAIQTSIAGTRARRGAIAKILGSKTVGCFLLRQTPTTVVCMLSARHQMRSYEARRFSRILKVRL